MNTLNNLRKSKFRSSFHLKEKDIAYINNKGFSVIEKHTLDFVNNRLKTLTYKDGKQTPFKGHPVFIAQHATATCCRSCLEKWHHIPKNKTLSAQEIRNITDLIISWIKEEYRLNK